MAPVSKRWRDAVGFIFPPRADAAEAAEFATFVGQGARLLQGQPDETLKPRVRP